MKTLFSRLATLLLLTFLISCSKDDDGGGGSSVNGKFTGTVVTPSGKTVAGAKISAGGFSTRSDASGRFSLDAAPGTYQLTIYTGSGTIFKTVVPCTLKSGEIVQLTASQTRLEQIKQLAYIPGQYDAIQTVIIDSLGFSATAIGPWDLDNMSSLTNYGGIFLNCGLLELGSGFNMNATRYQNLLDYVSNYGSLYVSDWAVECLTGDGNLRLSQPQGPALHNHTVRGASATATCWTPLLGGFVEDSVLCTNKSGPSGFFTDAVIQDPNLIAAVGNDSIDVTYDLQNWEMINLYDVPFTPIITHQFFGPIAVKADLNTGNACGNIYFTTFHNQPQGINNDVEAILNYIILNL